MAAPARSREQLVERALRVMGVVPAGQSADQEDARVVDDFVEPLLARLEAEGITTIDNPDAIPAAQFLDVAVLLADDAKTDFGMTALPGFDPMKSEMRIRTVVSTGPTMETVETTDPDTGEDVTYDQPQTLAPEYF